MNNINNDKELWSDIRSLWNSINKSIETTNNLFDDYLTHYLKYSTDEKDIQIKSICKKIYDANSLFNIKIRDIKNLKTDYEKKLLFQELELLIKDCSDNIYRFKNIVNYFEDKEKIELAKIEKQEKELRKKRAEELIAKRAAQKEKERLIKLEKEKIWAKKQQELLDEQNRIKKEYEEMSKKKLLIDYDVAPKKDEKIVDEKKEIIHKIEIEKIKIVEPIKEKIESKEIIHEEIDSTKVGIKDKIVNNNNEKLSLDTYKKAKKMHSNKEYEKAIELYKKSFELNQNENAAYNLGVIFFDKSDYENALLYFDLTLKINPLSPDAIYNKIVISALIDNKELTLKNLNLLKNINHNLYDEICYLF